MGMTAGAVALWQRIPPPSRPVLRRLAWASLAANALLVATGGAVRLTDSGLGCPTWPQCTAGSLVVHDAMGIHGFIEFGNRLLTFVLAAVAVATWVAAMRYQPARRSIRWLATILALGIPAQAVIGGVTVLSELNPWIVALHLLCSLAIIGVAVVLIRRVDEGDDPPALVVPPAVAWLGRATFAATWAVLYLGTIVTGSGPHAGSATSPRTGLNPEAMAQLHADIVFLLVGLTIGTALAMRAASAPPRPQRAVWLMLGVEIAQGVIGYVQYFTHLPVALVGAHVFGASVVSATAAWLLVSLRDRGEPAPALARVPAAERAAAPEPDPTTAVG